MGEQRLESQAVEVGTGSATSDRQGASAWRDVVEQLDVLGEAIGRWATAAAADPENKRRADELAARFEGLMSVAGRAIKSAADSEAGQSLREAADKTGGVILQAGERVSEEVGPRLASALRSAAQRLGQAAERMEDRAAASADADSAGDTPVRGATGGEKAGTDG